MPNAATMRQRRRAHQRAITEINVAPFVDVMLVLVIIFMVAAPLLAVGVPVDLPQAEVSALNEEQEPLVVTVDRDGGIYLQEERLLPEALVPRLAAITDANPDVRIFVRGDREIRYGRVMEIMGMISSAGFTRVALVAELPSGDGGAR